MYYLVRIRGIEQGEGKALHFARPLIRRGGAERVIIGEGTLVDKQQRLRAVHIAKTGQGKAKRVNPAVVKQVIIQCPSS